jgi:hypothetical protein
MLIWNIKIKNVNSSNSCWIYNLVKSMNQSKRRTKSSWKIFKFYDISIRFWLKKETKKIYPRPLENFSLVLSYVVIRYDIFYSPNLLNEIYAATSCFHTQKHQTRKENFFCYFLRWTFACFTQNVFVSWANYSRIWIKFNKPKNEIHS